MYKRNTRAYFTFSDFYAVKARFCPGACSPRSSLVPMFFDCEIGEILIPFKRVVIVLSSGMKSII